MPRLRGKNILVTGGGSGTGQANPPVRLHIVAARLGDDPTVLLGVYAHLLPRSDVQAVDAVAAVLVERLRFTGE